MNPFKTIFPFTAIIGQDNLKTALILNAVNPKTGGVLIRGEKGTAKSTAVRALAGVLPVMERHAGCAFSCDPGKPWEWCPFCRNPGAAPVVVKTKIPVITLPLSATEDRVAGGLDFNLAVQSGRRVLSPGLLADAHRGILYVDEVNLLDDHIVDILLDAAASGENTVEREGMAFVHPSRFILVGTMNPEEGELRPQLLDRFGLCVDVSSEKDPDRRVALMTARDDFDRDPTAFAVRHSLETRELAERILSARTLLSSVVFPGYLRTLVSELVMENNAAGHRADLVIEQAAKALSAFEGRKEVTVEDVRKVAGFALMHRKRDASPPPPPSSKNHGHDHTHHPPEKENAEENRDDRPDPQPHENDSGQGQTDECQGDDTEHLDGETGEDGERDQERQRVTDSLFEVGETFKVKKIAPPKDRVVRNGSGKRSRTWTAMKQGRYVKSGNGKGGHDIAFDATLRAAAPYQLSRKTAGENQTLAVVLKNQDIREKIREKRMGNFLLFVVDGSGSMGARGRMTASKGAVMSLLLDAYQKRDKVALVTFRKDGAWVNLPPTSSIELAARLLADMPVGGKTPLAAGLVKGFELVKNHLLREPDARPMMIVITDGRANVPLTGAKPLGEVLGIAEKIAGEPRLSTIVVDTESQGPVRFGLARKLADALSAACFRIDDLKAHRLVEVVKRKREEYA